MNDSGFDADLAERMLRGEATGPPELAKLLAAAASDLASEDLSGEEMAVAAFREKKPRLDRPRRRWFAAVAGLKAALIGLLIALVGGITVAAASQHLPGTPGNGRHPHGGRTPATSPTGTTDLLPEAPLPRPTTDRSGEHSPNPHANKSHSKKPHPPKGPKPHVPPRTTIETPTEPTLPSTDPLKTPSGSARPQDGPANTEDDPADTEGDGSVNDVQPTLKSVEGTGTPARSSR